MPAVKKTTEDNYYRRAQYEELIRTEFPPLKVFEADDGTEFFIEHPAARSDETEEALEPIEETDKRGMARVLLDGYGGEGTYDKFKSAGGQTWMIGYHYTKLVERETGKKPGEETPTT